MFYDLFKLFSLPKKRSPRTQAPALGFVEKPLSPGTIYHVSGVLPGSSGVIHTVRCIVEPIAPKLTNEDDATNYAVVSYVTENEKRPEILKAASLVLGGDRKQFRLLFTATLKVGKPLMLCNLPVDLSRRKGFVSSLLAIEICRFWAGMAEREHYLLKDVLLRENVESAHFWTCAALVKYAELTE